MKIQPYATLFAITLLASIAGATTARTTPSAAETVALRAHCDASLESLRAGRIETPIVLDAADRVELRAAETQSPDLLEMRAGDLTDREWTMVAVGALVLLVIIILV